VLQRYGKQLTQQAQRAALGKRPLDCWRDVAAILGLSDTVTAEQLVAETEPLLAARWVGGALTCHLTSLGGGGVSGWVGCIMWSWGTGWFIKWLATAGGTEM
jgi:hypothetical protein